MLDKLNIETLKLIALEKAMQSNLDLIEDIETNEYFNDEIYLREMKAKKGTLLTGKLHKTKHFSILAKGKIKINLGDGKVKYIKAPAIIESQEYTKKLIFCLTNISFINILHNKLKLKGDKLEDYFVISNDAQNELVGLD